MTEWNNATLADVVELVIDYRGKTPKKLGSDWCNDGYRALSAKNIKTGQIVQEDAIRYVDEELYCKWMKEEIKRGDILVTSEAPFGQIYFWDSDEKIVLSQRLFAIRIKKEFDARYIYQYMTTPLFYEEMSAHATGTTVIGLRQPELMKCKIKYPNIETQKKISAILCTIDRKINVNTLINDNLEKQAKVIYESIFIANTESSWINGYLSDLVTIKYGKDHKKLSDGKYPVYGSGGIMRYVNKPLYSKESVLIPRKGSLNNVMYVDEPFWSVDTMFYTQMHQPNIAKFIYHFVKSKNLAAMNAGSAVPSMTTDILNALEVVIPPREIFDSYENIVHPMYVTMGKNRKESVILGALRDSILPQLMSGELDVSNINI